MVNRTCTEDGCDRKHWARGFCASHYGAWHRRENGRCRNGDYFEITCHTCGAKHLSTRREGKYCSLLCRDFDKWGARTCVWPRPTPRLKPEPPPPLPEVTRACAWCEEPFTTRVATKLFCCLDHKSKAKRYKRRGRQAGSTSHFTWGEFVRLCRAFDWQCAYCGESQDECLEPEHVVPLSRGGSNGITNILPSCRPCNSDKRDLLLHEWATDRTRRRLPPRTTDPGSDPRWHHLTDALLLHLAAA